jgi:hypothetical protein
MLAFAGDIVAGGEIIDEFDVRDEARAGEGPLEQVMAEQRILRDPPVERRFEGIDVVDAFAGVGAYDSSIRSRSVNVPPTSTPRRKLICRETPCRSLSMPERTMSPFRAR